MAVEAIQPRPKAGGEPGGVRLLDVARLLQSASGALLVQTLLHGHLARVEWEEEKNRLLKMLLATLLGFACLLCILLFGGVLILATSWETAYRIPALLCLILFYGCGVAAAWWRFQVWSALGAQTFAATREELAADAGVLKNSL